MTVLGIGPQVTTGPDGDVILEFADKTRYILRESGELILGTLSAYGTTRMVDTRIRQGRSSAIVTPASGPGSQFIITTPAAVAAVRGTV